MGTNSVLALTLTSYGTMGVTNLGTVDNTGLTDILVTQQQRGEAS